MNTKHKISWTAQRYSTEIENMHMQIGASFIMGCLLVGAIIYKNYLFGAIILIGSILVYQTKKNDSDFIPIDIDAQGISVNNEMVLYDKISAFYIDEYEDGNHLLYRLKNTLINPTQVIVIEPEVDIDELRAFILQHLTEKEIKQSSTDKLINSF